MAKVDLKDRLNAKQRVQPKVSSDDLLMGDESNVVNDNINNIDIINKNDKYVIANESIDGLVPFATRLPESLILRLKQHQYWDREIIMDTVVNALNNYLNEFPDSNKPLPIGVLEKLSNKGRKKKK